MTCREEKRKWPAGISQSERQKSSQLFILAGAKRAPEQVVQNGASGATEEEKKRERKTKKMMTIKNNSPLPNLGMLLFVPGTYCFAQRYYVFS